MNLIERVASKAFYDNGHLYHSIESAQGFFEAKCKEHGLEDWVFKVVSSTSKRNIGYCRRWGKIIAIQAHFFFAMTADQVEETILHELAHALTPGEGHSAVWRAKAIELGDKRARATVNIRGGEGFRSDWLITSGHTRQESDFDKVAFTNKELPRSKKASSPNFGGEVKRVAKPTKLAMSIYANFKNELGGFINEMISLGYKEKYAMIQWKLCKEFA